MRFFEKARPEVYIHTAKLKRDKKSGKRLWQFTLIVTMTQQAVETCGVPVAKAWDYILDQDSTAADVRLAVEIVGCAIDFFAEIDDASPVLHLDGVDLTGLRFTREGNTVEFWFSGEHVNEGGIHDFMKPYAYTRVWAAFTPSQGELPIADPAPAAVQEKLAQDPAFLNAADRLVSSVRNGGIDSITLQTFGPEGRSVTIDREGAERIHQRAKNAQASAKARPEEKEVADKPRSNRGTARAVHL
jgi:hypothetical protein